MRPNYPIYCPLDGEEIEATECPACRYVAEVSERGVRCGISLETATLPGGENPGKEPGRGES